MKILNFNYFAPADQLSQQKQFEIIPTFPSYLITCLNTVFDVCVDKHIGRNTISLKACMLWILIIE